MLYAITDIETTGGYASGNSITEVAIVIHDGEKVIDRYETLVNPGAAIPWHIQSLTGITNEMVADAPYFSEVAEKIYTLLHDKVFVAHNVNFDYSFLHHHLQHAGYTLQTKKLCTVRLSRKIFPGFPTYSLGDLCRRLDIGIKGRHRAGGDANATVELFELLLKNDSEAHILKALSVRSKEQSLPANLPKAQVDQLPPTPGVYFFHDQKEKVIYVGKAKNLKKRVSSHFSNNNPGPQKQAFLRNIYSITFQETGTELQALIIESVEIRKRWPLYNRAQKRPDLAYGLYSFEDQNGYLRLAIDKRRKHSTPLHSFSLLTEGHNVLRLLMKEFRLCPKLCFLQTNNGDCVGIDESHCDGACMTMEAPVDYNLKVKKALLHLEETLPTFLLQEPGRNSDEQCCLLVEQGVLRGMAFVQEDPAALNLEQWKEKIEPLPGNAYLNNLVIRAAIGAPHRTLELV